MGLVGSGCKSGERERARQWGGVGARGVKERSLLMDFPSYTILFDGLYRRLVTFTPSGKHSYLLTIAALVGATGLRAGMTLLWSGGEGERTSLASASPARADGGSGPIVTRL